MIIKEEKKKPKPLLEGYRDSKSIASELGWKVSKVEKFCRATGVRYTTGSRGYIIIYDDFKTNFHRWLRQNGERDPSRRISVSQLDEARLKKRRKVIERAREREQSK